MVKHTLNRDCCAKGGEDDEVDAAKRRSGEFNSTRLRMQTGECQTTRKLNGTLIMKARSVANKIVKESIPISIPTGYVQLCLLTRSPD